ncbi:putative phosphatase regulatory subunit-domain-containing protein [Paraphysoderma sedebokerense]|nr:putative phosphatase regulatory subunit-domain-containing protein [Paraphysoderma sedebokerense]
MSTESLHLPWPTHHTSPLDIPSSSSRGRKRYSCDFTQSISHSLPASPSFSHSSQHFHGQHYHNSFTQLVTALSLSPRVSRIYTPADFTTMVPLIQASYVGNLSGVNGNSIHASSRLGPNHTQFHNNNGIGNTSRRRSHSCVVPLVKNPELTSNVNSCNSVLSNKHGMENGNAHRRSKSENDLVGAYNTLLLLADEKEDKENINCEKPDEPSEIETNTNANDILDNLPPSTTSTQSQSLLNVDPSSQTLPSLKEVVNTSITSKPIPPPIVTDFPRPQLSRLKSALKLSPSLTPSSKRSVIFPSHLGHVRFFRRNDKPADVNSPNWVSADESAKPLYQDALSTSNWPVAIGLGTGLTESRQLAVENIKLSNQSIARLSPSCESAFPFPPVEADQSVQSHSSLSPPHSPRRLPSPIPSPSTPLPPTPTFLQGTIQVRNLAYEKSVTVRFSTDQWRSYKEVKANYLNTAVQSGWGAPDIDRFGWEIEITADSTIQSHDKLTLKPDSSVTIDFCARYDVNGTTYWDNNQGRNYQATIMRQLADDDDVDVKVDGSDRDPNSQDFAMDDCIVGSGSRTSAGNSSSNSGPTENQLKTSPVHNVSPFSARYNFPSIKKPSAGKYQFPKYILDVQPSPSSSCQTSTASSMEIPQHRISSNSSSPSCSPPSSIFFASPRSQSPHIPIPIPSSPTSYSAHLRSSPHQLKSTQNNPASAQPKGQSHYQSPQPNDKIRPSSLYANPYGDYQMNGHYGAGFSSYYGNSSGSSFPSYGYSSSPTSSSSFTSLHSNSPSSSSPVNGSFPIKKSENSS